MTPHHTSARAALLPFALAALAIVAPRAAAAQGAATPVAQPASRVAPTRVEPMRIPRLYTPDAPGATLACAPAESRDLDALSDEFGDAATFAGASARWRWFHEQNGWPTMLRRTAGGAAAQGHLYLEPAIGGWFADYHAPLLYQTVGGDFDVTARVRATSVHGDSLPRATWSLVGLMARVPRAVSPDSWQPRGENWLFITTGIGEAPGVPVIETKSTVNSGSNLKLRPARAGWHELRVVRLRETFLLLSRAEGETAWRLRERVMRRDVPHTMQVGLIAYSDGTNTPPAWRDPRVHNTADSTTRAGIGAPDLAAHVDWVRFRRPPVLRDVAPDWLTDHAVPESTILRFLDCGAATR